jgi:1,4-dihydroxy-2-naphthoyl-CoA synthase
VNTSEIEHPKPSVAILRLNRPQSLNALSWELVEELHTALDEIDRNNQCRVVVLTGAALPWHSVATSASPRARRSSVFSSFALAFRVATSERATCYRV